MSCSTKSSPSSCSSSWALAGDDDDMLSLPLKLLLALEIEAPPTPAAAMRRIGICWASLESKDGAEIVFEEVNDDEEEEDVVVLVGAAVLEEGAGELLGGGVDSRIQPAPMLLKRRRMLCIMVARAATMEARGAAGPHASERARGRESRRGAAHREAREASDGRQQWLHNNGSGSGCSKGGCWWWCGRGASEGARPPADGAVGCDADERESRGECAGV